MAFSDLMKKWHKKYVEDEEEKTHFSHSLSYHTYFQGYSEKKVVRPGGGYSIVREYTADYLAFTEKKQEWILRKVLYAIFYFGSAALTLLALFSHSRANSAGWVAVFGVLQMVMLLLMLIPLGNYLLAPIYLRMGQFNISARRLSHFAVPTSVFAGLYLITAVSWYMANQSIPAGKDVLCLVFQLAATAMILALTVWEGKTTYKRIANDAVKKTGFDGNEIW